MNSAVLVAALLTPLVGAVVALLIPSGRRSAAAGLRGRRGRRLRKGKDEPGESSVEGAPTGSPATESPPAGVAAPAGT
ncbi:MAG: hypothetical protein M3535_08385, partial [Actinomycetota bacterium]|nr:hypothetical protein [Actinomycetota bacterium]